MLLGAGLALLGAKPVAAAVATSREKVPEGDLPFRISLNTSTISGYDLPVERQIACCAEAGFDLKKGASAAVRQQAKDIVAKFGASGLKRFAKLHFKTAAEAVSGD